MDGYLVFILSIAILLSGIGLIVITKNTRSSSHRSFFLASIFLALWIVTNFLSNDQNISLTAARVSNHLVLATSGLGITFLLRYIGAISPNSLAYKFRNHATLVNIISNLLCLTPLVVAGIARQGQVYAITFGPLANVYFFTLIASIIWSTITLITSFKKSTGIERSRLSVIMLSFALTVGFAVATNLVAPLLGNSFALTNLGPLSVTFLVVGVAYTMIRHQLFDIRLVVARALGYILSILAVGALYSSVAFLALNRLIFNNTTVSSAEEIAYTLLALFLAFTFQPIKNFFDIVTKKIFYRDAYDTQKTLAQISNIIVGNINPRKLQKGTLGVITEALKPAYAAFLLHSPAKEELIKGEIVGQQWSMHEPKELTNILKNIGRKIVVYDEVDTSRIKLKDTLRLEDINLVAPLITKEETIGYLILGPKKSGNIYTTQDTEVLKLATNELSVALQNAQRFEEIQAFNITLQEKITEATRELKVTNKKLIALDEAKDEFISMASHQLRTPLTSIKGYISMILEGDLGKISAAQEKALKEAFTSSQRMVFLISDFLNVSRIKTGKFVIELKELFMPTMIQEELTQLREMFEAKSLQHTYDAPEEFPIVKLDDNKTRQVMMNMIDNAIYYTPAGGSINIQLYSNGDEIIFKVIDTGIGVPKNEQHKLFTKFFRAGNARKARPDGTGLGLYMAQKVVLEQGGSIIFESAEGKGSTFGFRFPLSKIKA